MEDYFDDCELNGYDDYCDDFNTYEERQVWLDEMVDSQDEDYDDDNADDIEEG